MKTHLEKLFSSKTRVKLLTLFLRNPEQPFYVRELTRKLKERINSVRRELENLSKIGLLKSRKKDMKKYYQINDKFPLLEEIHALFMKATAAPKDKITMKLKKVGKISYACLTGTFTKSRSKADLLIVGSVDDDKLADFIKGLEKEQGQEIKYAVMDKNEFNYRLELEDQFLKSIIDKDKIDLIGKV